MISIREGIAVEALFFYHVRRAGGTSLRNYFQRFALEKGLRYEVCEGHSLDYERYFERSPGTLRAICLRDPIERIKTSYRTEGRWPPKESRLTAENAKPFSVWADGNRCNDGGTRNLWSCTENYYTKVLISYPLGWTGRVDPADLELAKQRLEQFDLVLVTEQLSWPETSAYLRRALGCNMPMPHVNQTKRRRMLETDAELFDHPTLKWLYEANRADRALYEYARTLLRTRMNAARPGHSREGPLSETGPASGSRPPFPRVGDPT